MNKIPIIKMEAAIKADLETIRNLRRRCPICLDMRSSMVYDDPVILKCTECGHAFRLNRDSSLIPDYSGKLKMPYIIEAQYYARYHYDLIERYIGFKKINSIMEIGSGDGALIKRIRQKNPSIGLCAIEASREHSANLRKIPNIKVINDYIENVHLDQQFDLIILSFVLEHISEPMALLKLIYEKYLNSNGHLLIIVPSYEFELYSQSVARMAFSGHITFFDGQKLIGTLASIGFSSELISGHKYRTTPSNYCRLMEKIASFQNSRTFLGISAKYYYKIIRRLSVNMKTVLQYCINKSPSEIGIQEINSSYNNIAIFARKNCMRNSS